MTVIADVTSPIPAHKTKFCDFAGLWLEVENVSELKWPVCMNATPPRAAKRGAGAGKSGDREKTSGLKRITGLEIIKTQSQVQFSLHHTSQSKLNSPKPRACC
jgi:hypothetical protein